jgi:hypothetical protein
MKGSSIYDYVTTIVIFRQFRILSIRAGKSRDGEGRMKNRREEK